MDVTPLILEGRQIIQSYSAGLFKVSGKIYQTAIIVQPLGTTVWPAPQLFADLSEDDFALLAANEAEIDVLLLGTGAKGEFLSPKLRAALKAKGLIVDAMDTGAACRTYNVLMAEGRRVAAALMPHLNI